jgi:hypothetical protein
MGVGGGPGLVCVRWVGHRGRRLSTRVASVSRNRQCLSRWCEPGHKACWRLVLKFPVMEGSAHAIREAASNSRGGGGRSHFVATVPCGFSFGRAVALA